MKRFRFLDNILLENEDLLILNKPSGLSSLTEREEELDSVLSFAKSIDPHFQLCHRLDKDTTGCLIIAKRPEVYRHISIQFERRQVEKKYHALVQGVYSLQDQLIDLPLSTTRSNRSQVNTLKGKESKTIVSSIEHFDHYTLIEARPITGRLHQIRAHLASMQMPIVQDIDYGGASLLLSSLKKNYSLSKGGEERPLIQRMALHAHSISFKGLDGKKIKGAAAYPKDFAVLLKQLRKYDQSRIL